ncbi:MAG: hypothetical protein ACP5K8_07285 [Nitrososphaeria archaeon]
MAVSPVFVKSISISFNFPDTKVVGSTFIEIGDSFAVVFKRKVI